MKRSFYISLIVIITVLINIPIFSCLEAENSVHCNNNSPGPCTVECCTDNEGGSIAGGGGNITAGKESSLHSKSSGLAKLSYTSTAPGVLTTYYGDIVPGKYFTTFKLSFLNQPSNGRFSLTLTLTYCSEYFIFARNENGGTMFGPGWFSDYEIYLAERTGGAEGDLQFRSATGHPQLLVKQQDGSWKGYALFGFPVTMTKSGSYYYLKFDDDRTEYKFDGVEGGRIISSKDGLGNELVWTYNGNDQLTRIDSNSTLSGSDIDERYLTFDYTSGRCTKITASDGRELHFTYDENDPSRLTYIKYKKSSGGTLYTLYQFIYGTDEDAFYCIEELKTNRADGTFGTLFQYTYDYTTTDANCNSLVTGKKDADGNYIYQVDYLREYGEYGGIIGVQVTTASGAFTKHYLNFVRYPEKSEYYNSSEELVKTYYQDTLYWHEVGSDYLRGTHVGDSFTTYTYQYEGNDYFDVRGSRIGRIDYSDDTFITNTYNVDGYISSHKDARGKITDYTYDSNGLLETVTNPLDHTTTYDYDSLGRLISVTGPDDLATTYTYTDEGQIKTVIVPGPLTTTYNYNDYGWLTSVFDPNNRAMTYTYNDFGMKKKVTNSENKDWDYEYNTRGTLLSVTDPKNNSTEYTHNKKGFLTKTTNALDKEMCFSYNSLGLLDTVKDQRGKFVTYTYDCFGRMTEEKNDEGITTTYTYYDEGCGSCGGSVGKLKTKTDGKHITLTYTYDIMGRLDKIDYPNSEYVSYTYNANGNRLSMKDTRINYGDEKFTWEYDDLNRVTKEIYPDDEYITYAYTVGGSRASMRIPNSTYQKYTYDSRGRLSTLQHGNSTYTWNYNNDNTLSRIDYPNENENYFTYDNLYRISQIKASLEQGTDWYIVDYTYDDVGNRTKAEWDSTEFSMYQYTKNYTYDNIYQLLSEKKKNQAETSRLYEYQYAFDDAGNRTQMKYYDGSTTTTTNYYYNDPNRMTSRSVYYGPIWYYEYDNNGNLTEEDMEEDSQRELTWNNDNRLTYVDNVADNKEVEYTYDGMGRRIMRKDVDNNTYTRYYYDGLSVIAERKKIGEGSWSYSCYYTVAPSVIGNILYQSSSDTHFHYDALGNVIMTTYSDSTPGSKYEQEAYGNVKTGSQSGYHLTAKEYDSISELYYFSARFYDPLIGRFINQDPIRYINRFWYCSNNPLSLIDPDGMDVLDMYEEYERRWDSAIDSCLKDSKVCGMTGGGGYSGNCCTFVQCVIQRSEMNPLNGGGIDLTSSPGKDISFTGIGVLCQAGRPEDCVECVNNGRGKGHIAVIRSDGKICQCKEKEIGGRTKLYSTCDEPWSSRKPPNFFFPIYIP